MAAVRVALVALALLVTWMTAAFAATSRPVPGNAVERPNIVFILSDDEDSKAHRYLPKVRSLVEDQGAVFENYFVTYSFCCPSRATALRGQYAHNHRIVGNDEPTGGFRKFRFLGQESSTIATWLQDAGYHTALIGKYLNHYDPAADAPAPGWSEWYVPGSYNYAYFDYLLNENGKPVSYGHKDEDYLTDVLTRHAVDVIRRSSAAEQPFFLYLAPYAPHAPATSAPRHAAAFADQTYPRTPAFDEAEVGDKPSIVREQPRLAAWQLEAIDRHWRERLRSMQSVDDMVAQVVQTLQATGQLDRTYIVYASDNGFHMGEHRMFFGKTTAYEEDIRVPMAIRGPGIPAGLRVSQFVLNNDLAPTFAALAGVTPPTFVDGRSFLPLFKEPVPNWRRSFVVERRQRETHEITGAAAFDAIRTQHWTYVEYGNGERELYNLRTDPHQQVNAFSRADPDLIAALSGRLAELVNCAGPSCRQIEDQPIEPTFEVSGGPANTL
jgi:arylsulfatase A-like enzyme